jgi:hypothetical protein
VTTNPKGLVDEIATEVMTRVERVIDQQTGVLGTLAADLLERHGYRLSPEGSGPHANVLGHPLFELPIWLASVPSRSPEVTRETLLDVCESSLWGYLSVRGDDDLFDGDVDDPESVLMLSTFLRTRHQALLAPLVTDQRFWARFATLWSSYGEAMLLERALHKPEATYGREEFEKVLGRSQPLEIPGDAILTLQGRWDDAAEFGALVKDVTRATQLIDDFVDASSDLAAGNLTWMVRRLGGMDGERALKIGMVTMWDQVREEAAASLAEAEKRAERLGVVDLSAWAAERTQLIAAATDRMYFALFDGMSPSHDVVR